MKTLSIINLKGGVAKTISSVNMAHILAAVHHFKVLLVDNDKQGNSSKILNRHSYDHKGTAEVMTERGVDMTEVIQHTEYAGLDIITANMNLLTANLEVMLDHTRPYLILKNEGYSVGDTVRMIEFTEGRATGNIADMKIVCMDDDDTSSALDTGYCVIALREVAMWHETGEEAGETAAMETMQPGA